MYLDHVTFTIVFDRKHVAANVLSLEEGTCWVNSQELLLISDFDYLFWSTIVILGAEIGLEEVELNLT